MRLNNELQRILDGKEGIIKQEALKSLIRYGEAMGAEDFVPITSAHTAFSAIDVVALAFPPRGRKLSKEDIESFTKEISKTRVAVKTTVNPGILDRKKWQDMGANEEIYQSAINAVDIARKLGMIATFNCTPQVNDNIPLMGQHCAWAESSAHLYINSFYGARTNRDSYETSLYAALIGYTPKFGLHLDENRKGTDIIDVQCELNNTQDWGVLGYFTGAKVGIGIPVYKNIKKVPTVEDAIQLTANCNSTGAIPMLMIPGVSPEAPTLKAAFKGDVPRAIYTFDEKEKRKIYDSLSYQAKGKVDMVFLGCPHKTLYDLVQIAKMLEGKKIAKNTRFWIATASSSRNTAEELGYAKIIEDSGAELFADGCLALYYVNAPAKRPKLGRVVSDSAKQTFIARRSFKSNIHFATTQECINIAIKGGIE